MKLLFSALLLLSLAATVFAAKVPDIPSGSKIFLENKSQSDEATRFQMLLEDKLAQNEGAKHHLKPGFPIAEKKEEAAYVLRFVLVTRSPERGFLEARAKAHTILDVWLLDPKGSRIWAKEYDCIAVFHEPAQECINWLSDDLKEAQVNSDGKRAGMLGWKQK